MTTCVWQNNILIFGNMDLDSYLTVESEGSAQFVEQRSRFLSFAAFVENEASALDYVAALRRKYHDARHVCYAFRLRGGLERSSDDGEPSGTAGRPILGRLDAAGMENVVVVVVRYFGGVKLGTGGLVRAYRTAAQLALDASVMAPRQVWVTMRCTFDYALMNAVMQLTRRFGINVRERKYDDARCVLLLDVQPSVCDSVRQCVANWRAGVEIEIL